MFGTSPASPRAASDWRSVRDGRERDRAYAALLMAPGVAYARLADLDVRIAEQTEPRDRAQRTLHAWIAQADALRVPVPA